MEELDNSAINPEGAILAYSLPGSTEFTTATIRDLVIAKVQDKMEDFDWVLSPFNLVQEKRILIKISSYAANRKFSCHPRDTLTGIETTKEKYAENFEEMHALIKSGAVQKMVLSRSKYLIAENGDIYPHFISLKNLHPDAFTYLVHLPDIGTWIGASPEKLLEITQSGNYLTKAVAGTLPIEDGNMPIWGKKEIEEHHIIETYLEKALEDKKLKFSISPSYSIAAGNMAHISSEITISPGDSYELADLLDLIHPSPALGGMPKDKAVTEICRIEKESRAYYCGFFGPLKGETGLALFANIRCAQVYKNGFKLYLGGGITAASDLEKEWAETELKAQTLLAPLAMTRQISSES